GQGLPAPAAVLRPPQRARVDAGPYRPLVRGHGDGADGQGGELVADLRPRRAGVVAAPEPGVLRAAPDALGVGRIGGPAPRGPPTPRRPAASPPRTTSSPSSSAR